MTFINLPITREPGLCLFYETLRYLSQHKTEKDLKSSSLKAIYNCDSYTPQRSLQICPQIKNRQKLKIKFILLPVCLICFK